MKLHEHQSKELLKKYGLPVPEGYAAFNVKEAKEAAQALGGYPLVVKAQIHCGARGKAGGVKIVKSDEELEAFSEAILGKILKTVQCPNGKVVSRLLIEKATPIEKEFYLSITLDRSNSKILIMASKEGGMEIEELSKEKPDAIIKEYVDPVLGIMPYQTRKLSFALGLNPSLFGKIVSKLYQAYMDLDASLLEINPLVLTKDGDIVLLDAKVEIDDNAAFRHKDIEELEDITQIDPLEVEAKKYGLNYIKLEGNIGCMVNGAGLAMTTMDIIKLAGGAPANFLDVGGGASVEQIANAFRILTSDENVKAVFINIFGGILRCDRLANGLIEAAKIVNIKIPVVVRLEGTNVEEGRKLLKESGLNFESAVDMWDGAQKAIKLAQ
ncbi:succinyl-CoA synthetase, beta subunit [Hydrogenobaculum sp. Y04AAS1]|uniref:Succinate--CoA ligase [ADP-forming] subunit beta n=1 Tax=Hydrogenobaculum sp. (strain Y04AAS1) TaxID=380749 RepID=SUCC_HYDS0|nr:RecName: Full=Succinate--CoA ligase [ADP-forming] subunit beta; AltName: Full=Succinyl-CoA synthetase subunit beta; Short=SCS-beta [Hydrogenobaculum sp. Y04AAS1]ACG57612.1 succinyl-CoA synthetase, beta subunit [Hydrogenobaculum sp. Y04AAS1]HCT66178.1 ADP-forming succinate--CoA ligase subunit beta [Hydrogenobaculum sp.]